MVVASRAQVVNSLSKADQRRESNRLEFCKPCVYVCRCVRADQPSSPEQPKHFTIDDARTGNARREDAKGNTMLNAIVYVARCLAQRGSL